MQSNWKSMAGLFLGLSIWGGVFFANQLGMDNNPAWGPKRIAAFLLGSLIISIFLLYKRENFVGRIIHTSKGRAHGLIFILCSAIILAYGWWVTLGLLTSWPASTNYYDLQATAFSHGQLALEVKPDPALLALENPYEPGNRKNIPVLWDATLYKGKYYLYWGPTPALLITWVKPFYTKEIGDNFLTFFFTAGAFIFLMLLILEFRKNYFTNISDHLLLASIAISGLINPIPYILIEARIYETAIASGQFFFIGGLYFMFLSFRKPTSLISMITGVFFALAVGSRTVLLIPIAFLVVIFFFWTTTNYREKVLSLMTSLITPLILGGIAYAWYNFARFGSMTEFGYTYQLTGFNINARIKDTFSLAYIPPNLFKTLINPLEYKNTFPFIKPVLWGGPALWMVNYNPNIYYYLSEGITGLFIGSPFLIFAFLRKRKDLFWISISLTGSALLIFFITQIFFYTTMRYLLDLIPALTLLAIIGLWSGLDSIKSKKFLTILGTSLWAYTIVIGVLLPFSSNIKRIKEFNPDLFHQITTLFK